MYRLRFGFATLAIVLASSFANSNLLAAPPEQSALFVSEQKANLARLFADPDQIIGIEAIVAEGTSKAAFYSRYGHAMLRFVKADGDFSTDLVVSLVADADLSHLDVGKGLFGGYRILPLVRSYADFWDEYVRSADRPFSRYVIVSTPEMRRRLLDTLKAWVERPALGGTYTFLSNNCVGALARLLEQAGFPSYRGLNPRIPTHFGKWLRRSFLSPFPPLRVETAEKLFDLSASILGLDPVRFARGEDWPKDSATLLMSRLNDLQIKQLILNLGEMPYEVRAELARAHHYGNGGATLEEAMGFQPVPSALYGVCADDACVKDVISQAEPIWPEKAWKDALREDDFAYWLAVGNRDSSDDDLDWVDAPAPYHEDLRTAPKSLRAAPEVLVHEQLFLRALLGKH